MSDDEAEYVAPPVPPDPVTALDITLTLIQGDGLVAKDRNVLGQWTTSDPYCAVSLFPAGLHGPEIKLGKTEIIRYTLSPKWNQKFRVEVSDHVFTQDAQFVVTIMDWDEDWVPGMVQSDDDLMGVVPVNMPPGFVNQNRHVSSTKWYGVPKLSASRASGRVRCAVEITKSKKKYADIPEPVFRESSGKPIVDQATYSPEDDVVEKKGLFGKVRSSSKGDLSGADDKPDKSDKRSSMKKSLSVFGLGGGGGGGRGKKQKSKDLTGNDGDNLALRGSSKSFPTKPGTGGGSRDTSATRSRPSKPILMGSMTTLVDPNAGKQSEPKGPQDRQQTSQLNQILAARNMKRNSSNTNLQEMERKVKESAAILGAKEIMSDESKQHAETARMKFMSLLGKGKSKYNSMDASDNSNGGGSATPSALDGSEKEGVQRKSYVGLGGTFASGTMENLDMKNVYSRTALEEAAHKAEMEQQREEAEKRAKQEAYAAATNPIRNRGRGVHPVRASRSFRGSQRAMRTSVQNPMDSSQKSTGGGMEGSQRSHMSQMSWGSVGTTDSSQKNNKDNNKSRGRTPPRTRSRSPMRDSTRNKRSIPLPTASSDSANSNAEMPARQPSLAGMEEVLTARAAPQRLPSMKQARKASMENNSGVGGEGGDGSVRKLPQRLPSLKQARKASLEHNTPGEAPTTPPRGGRPMLSKSPSRRSMRNVRSFQDDPSTTPEATTTPRGGRPMLSKSPSRRSMRNVRSFQDDPSATPEATTTPRGGRPMLSKSPSRRSMRNVRSFQDDPSTTPEATTTPRGGRPMLSKSNSRRSMRNMKSFNDSPEGAVTPPKPVSRKTSMDLTDPQDPASARSSPRSVGPSPEYPQESPEQEGAIEAGYYIDEDGVQYYLDELGVEYYQDPVDGEWYADEITAAAAQQTGAAATPAVAAPQPAAEDESGFYEDANGTEYFLDKHGVEHYKEDIPEDADFGFFEDGDGVIYFVDEDGVEHYRRDDLLDAAGDVQSQQPGPAVVQPGAGEVDPAAVQGVQAGIVEPQPEDESGYYEDEDGTAYYLDRQGIEYYQNPTDGQWYSDTGILLQAVPVQ